MTFHSGSRVSGAKSSDISNGGCSLTVEDWTHLSHQSIGKNFFGQKTENFKQLQKILIFTSSYCRTRMKNIEETEQKKMEMLKKGVLPARVVQRAQKSFRDCVTREDDDVK